MAVALAERASQLDQTIVRVSMLTNEAVAGRTRVGSLGRRQVRTMLAHADLRKFIIKQIQDATRSQQSSVISN